MCPAEIEKLTEFVESGGSVIAFTPCSEFALAEEGSGMSPAEVIARLKESAPDRVHMAAPDSQWIEFARGPAPKDIKITLDGDYLAARRSVYEGARFVLVANASCDSASAHVEFADTQHVEIWDPWTGEVSRVDSEGAKIELQPYSAMIVTDGGR